jgi:hypothetical protein
MRLIDELNILHSSYVTAINGAIEQDYLTRAEQLAHAYDEEAIQLIAEREGKTHLLPLHRPARVETPLRRWVSRLRAGLAA